ncbi:hypothetical protein [Mycoplasma sp. E35C]|uniref:hypothetical protein n=1 Tax=Mycoplasma sp. E35C TaxID=2801918 RepID=UPI001CA3F96B|nr:hypothetical protein [Mycoplasma sp. E35C]QZX49321.1 hypothetical protein JJE79_01025 [Mycoplasma sp. E35C]
MKQLVLKKLYVWYLLNENLSQEELRQKLNKAKHQFVRMFKNESLTFKEITNQRIYYQFNTNTFDQFLVEFKPIVIYKDYDKLMLIIEQIINNAQSIIKNHKVDNQLLDVGKNKIIERIKRSLNYFDMQSAILTPEFDNPPGTLNMIDLVNEIFVSLLNEHILKNGNKRMAITFLSEFLYFSGIYLQYKKTDDQTVFAFTKTLNKFIEEYQQTRDRESMLRKFKAFILANSFIPLQLEADDLNEKDVKKTND